MRNHIMAALAAITLSPTSATASERPGWLPERPATYLAELLAEGGRVVAVLPALPPLRIPREATDFSNAAPVIVFVQHGPKLFRCPDVWEWVDGTGNAHRRQIVPGPCEIPIPRAGWPFAAPRPEQNP